MRRCNTMPTFNVHGDFCRLHHAPIFMCILEGTQALSILGGKIRMICSNPDSEHTETCQQAYNYRDLVLTTDSIVGFLNQNWAVLSHRPSIGTEMAQLIANVVATRAQYAEDTASPIRIACETPAALQYDKVKTVLRRHCLDPDADDVHTLLGCGVLRREDIERIPGLVSGPRDVAMIVNQYRDWVLHRQSPQVYIPHTRNCMLKLARQIQWCLHRTVLSGELVEMVMAFLFDATTLRLV